MVDATEGAIAARVTKQVIPTAGLQLDICLLDRAKLSYAALQNSKHLALSPAWPIDLKIREGIA